MGAGGVHGVDGEVVPVDAVDDGDGEGLPVLPDGGEEGRQPVEGHLNGTVQYSTVQYSTAS